MYLPADSQGPVASRLLFHCDDATDGMFETVLSNELSHDLTALFDNAICKHYLMTHFHA